MAKIKKKFSEFDMFDSPGGEVTPVVVTPTIEVSSIRVRNLSPSMRTATRIAIIGDQPYRADSYHQTPFCAQGTPEHPYSGAAGQALALRLSHASIVKDACFLGNICQHSGYERFIDKCKLDEPQIQTDIAELTEQLTTFNPTICILLGRAPLYLAKGVTDLDSWRGSVFISDRPGPFFGRKCIATFHPQFCLKKYVHFTLLSFDFRRAFTESKTFTFTPPTRDLRISPVVFDILCELSDLLYDKPKVGVDIEGYVDAMSCISFARSPSDAFIVPLATRGNENIYTEAEEVLIWQFLSAVLEDPGIHKVFQNGLYDRFVIQYSYGIVVRGNVDDTMLKHWELYCEFEKSLGFQTSIYTNEPFYKADRLTSDIETFHRYCCRDSAVTIEICNKLDGFALAFTPAMIQHYRFNMLLLNPLLYMENRGIAYDVDSAAKALVEVDKHYAVLQTELDGLTGKGCKFNTLPELLAQVQSIMCYKKDPNKPKSDYVEFYPRILQMIKDAHQSNLPLTPEQITFIAVESDLSMNIKSAKFKEYLYDILNLPVQYKKDKETGELKPTTDYEALLKLQKVSPTRVVDLAIQIGLLRTRSQMLHISADADGRVRCGYNIVGTETGRLSCYTSPTGSGYNLQTIPDADHSKPPGHPLRDGMRHLFRADPGHYMFQCDLSGADGWTVAAHCAALGDRTLLEDYLSGIKPAKVLCYLLRHGAASLNGKSRADIKSLTAEVKKEDWDYFACKIGQHGSCYLMGPQKLSEQIFVQSEGKISLSTKEVKDLQNLFFIRYRVKLWHEWMGRKLKTSPVIDAGSGYRRRFYGRPTEILGQALAHEPQAVTTYATNLAAYRLWTDKENRVYTDNRISLRIEPLHQVHDALVGQFLIEDTAWAVDKIKSYFANQMTIAGIKLTIPFEGNYGESWGSLKQGAI